MTSEKRFLDAYKINATATMIAILNEPEVPSGRIVVMAANYYDVLKLALEKGGDPNFTETDETYYYANYSTAIENSLAERNGLDLLLDYGADINIKNIDGETPLFNFVDLFFDNDEPGWTTDIYESIELLLSRSANVNEKGRRGMTALELAESKGDGNPIVELLKTPPWQIICDVLSDVNSEHLKRITISNINEDNFNEIAPTFKYEGTLEGFPDYFNELPKRTICKYLSLYYIVKKCPNNAIDLIDMTDLNSEDYKGEPLIYIEPNCYKLETIGKWFSPRQENRMSDPATRIPFTESQIEEIVRRRSRLNGFNVKNFLP
jgi:hypothetical protein